MLVGCDSDDGLPADVVSSDDVDASDPNDTEAADTVTPPGPDTALPPLGSCPDSPLAGGRVYMDNNRSSASHWDQDIADPSDAPAADVTVLLMSPGDGAPAVTSLSTCSDGTFGWSELSPGSHIVEVAVDDPDATTTRNVPARFPEAVREGNVVMVTFGDSISHFGPSPWFPAQLADLIAPVANVDNRNIAVPGSTSDEWLPGTAYFSRLQAELDDADVVVFSIGGNDLQQLADTFDTSNVEPNVLIDQGLALIADVQERLITVVEAVRAQALDADVVWLLYPNYTHSDQWGARLGDYQAAAQHLLTGVLEDMRSDFAAIDGVIVADMMSAIPNDLISDLLWDEVHLNAAGHRFYAERLFELLGGVVVGPAPTGLSRGVGLAP